MPSSYEEQKARYLANLEDKRKARADLEGMQQTEEALKSPESGEERQAKMLKRLDGILVLEEMRKLAGERGRISEQEEMIDQKLEEFTTESGENEEFFTESERKSKQEMLASKTETQKRLLELKNSLIELRRSLKQILLESMRAQGQEKNKSLKETVDRLDAIDRGDILEESEEFSSREWTEAIGNLEHFFESESSKIPEIKLRSGGSSASDAIKIFPDGRIIIREVEMGEYGAESSDIKEYRVITPKEASEFLEGSIVGYEQDINTLNVKKRKVEEGLSLLLKTRK